MVSILYLIHKIFDMKKLMFTGAVLLLVLSAGAQSRSTKVSNSAGTQFSLGVEAGLPVGQYPKGTGDNQLSHIVGASLQLENHVASDLGLTLNAGYLNYAYKKNYGGGSSGFIPVLAGLKYYFSPGGVFAHGQLGAAFGTSALQGTSFMYSPGIGINISQNLDAEVKYSGISNKAATLGSVGIRLAYNF